MSEMINPTTINATYLNVVNHLQNRNVRVFDSTPVNNGRYFLIRTKECNFLVVFKRDFFNSFGKIFADKGESGIGETINQKDLQFAVRFGVKQLVFTYPNNRMYKISVSDFLVYSYKRMNEEGKITRSINIKHLERWN